VTIKSSKTAINIADNSYFFSTSLSVIDTENAFYTKKSRSIFKSPFIEKCLVGFKDSPGAKSIINIENLEKINLKNLKQVENSLLSIDGKLI
jgi:hypothetical protein|tara:strand:- start:1226 stop:1501 length:276 start_codon:yes stop_codon:yes gene_type:complete